MYDQRCKPVLAWGDSNTNIHWVCDTSSDKISWFTLKLVRKGENIAKVYTRIHINVSNQLNTVSYSTYIPLTFNALHWLTDLGCMNLTQFFQPSEKLTTQLWMVIDEIGMGPMSYCNLVCVCVYISCVLNMCEMLSLTK